ncbi:TPA: CaiF/GrlA family transcriptional regulator [Salmonella enterica subsp. salamae serovar 9,46:z4,z24:z39:z42]|nr:CaiF/GrlA family transcriptional regulator [Salmonella enterica subsp. salamae serovar 9,46:z4,z24:z39:z42]
MKINKQHNGSGGQESGTGMRKKRSQSNHEEYIIPASMAPWAHEPLYLVIARWCSMQGRWINRNDIVRAFHMPERRASFQMSYISRKKDRVVCRVRTDDAGEARCLRNEIFVECILPAPARRQSCLTRRKTEARVPGPSSRRVGSGMSGNIGLWEKLLKAVREEAGDE